LRRYIKVSNDTYNRTTSEAHKKACATLFNLSKASGDIYLDTYEARAYSRPLFSSTQAALATNSTQGTQRIPKNAYVEPKSG